MLINTANITDLIPNLDSLTVEELDELRQQFKVLARGFTELGSYAEGKSAAIACRLEGKIVLAQRFEDATDVVYARLPDWAKSW